MSTHADVQALRSGVALVTDADFRSLLVRSDCQSLSARLFAIPVASAEHIDNASPVVNAVCVAVPVDTAVSLNISSLARALPPRQSVLPGPLKE